MKRSEAARYARWSAVTALLLATLTAGVYVQRKWVAHREREKAPPPAPRDVTRLSSGLTFSKVEGNHKIFTVEASRATDFKDQEASLLEDVKITIFGNAGTRHDTIHTQSCQYEKAGESIRCSGEVQMDMQSAAEAARAAKNPKEPGQKVHVETRGVTFNRSSGAAQTDQPVTFVFPGGGGEAIGVEYRSEEGSLRLLRDVRLSLMPPASGSARKRKAGPGAQDPVRVAGSSLDFERDSRTMRLRGPVEAQTARARMLGGELKLVLDLAFRAEKLVATAGANGKKPQLSSMGAEGPANLSAETLTAHFATEGWLTGIEGSGSVQGARRGGKGEDQFRADYASLELQPKVNDPKTLNLKGNVLLKTQTGKTAEARMLKTSALLVEFVRGEEGQGSKPKRAETLGHGSIEWEDAPPQNGTTSPPANGVARTKLQADKLEMEFGAGGKAKLVAAIGNVQTERAAAGQLTQTATAQTGIAQLLATGGWSQMDLQGNVRLKEGDRSGQADHAVFVRATQTALLTGRATVHDATTETQAPRITFLQAAGDMRAEGGVRSTDFASKGKAVQLAPVPANISADTLLANSKTGRALYSGHARLWQGDSVLEADSIELLRESRILNAAGNVRAIFPQAPAQTAALVRAAQAAPLRPRLWHVAAGTLAYHDAESRAHLEKNVVAQSAEQTMRAAVVDLHFTRAGAASANGASSGGGAQQINQAAGAGGVIVEQGTRKATAERGVYTAADGKFIMSGGNPTIYDASQGATTGRQLTFFLADDTIIVDSENGSRTLTKHRVEQ